jgi:hypothetical protein
MPHRVTASKKEWMLFVTHQEGCGDCVRCQDVFDKEKVETLMCGEGRELLAVARMHTHEELEAGE